MRGSARPAVDPDLSEARRLVLGLISGGVLWIHTVSTVLRVSSPPVAFARRAAVAAGGAAALGPAGAAAAPPRMRPRRHASTDEQGGSRSCSSRPSAPARCAQGRRGRHVDLTADIWPGQTIYFSDRPERIVGMVSTERFLGSRGPSTASPRRREESASPRTTRRTRPWSSPATRAIRDPATSSWWN